MADMNELERARLRKTTDNTKLTPVELLKLLIDDIERGECKCDGLVILTVNRPEGEPWEYGSYRCQMTRDQELVAVVLAQERTVRNWLADK